MGGLNGTTRESEMFVKAAETVWRVSGGRRSRFSPVSLLECNFDGKILTVDDFRNIFSIILASQCAGNHTADVLFLD